MLTNNQRRYYYWSTNRNKKLTPRQLRRMRKKLNRNLDRIPWLKGH